MDENKKKGQFMGSVVFIFHTSANITIGVKSAPIWPHLFMVKELQHDISPNVCVIFKYFFLCVRSCLRCSVIVISTFFFPLCVCVTAKLGSSIGERGACWFG